MTEPEEAPKAGQGLSSTPPMKNFPFFLSTIHARDELFYMLWGNNQREDVKRVGVPGHEPYNYKSMFSLRGFQHLFIAVHQSQMFWFHIMIVFIILCTISAVPESSSVALAHFPSYLSAPLRQFCVFTLTFYISQVYSKWNARFENVAKTNGNVTRLTAVAAGTLHKHDAETLMRFVNAIMHIYYLMLSGPLDDEKWELLRCRGLLTEEEIEKLQLQGSPAVVLYSWASKIINANALGENGHQLLHMWMTMEEEFGGARGLAAKQIAYELTQIPYIYNATVNYAINAYLICTAFDGASNEWFRCWHQTCAKRAANSPWPYDSSGSCTVCLVFVALAQYCMIFIFTAGFVTATKMSEAYGPGVSHYDLGVDLDNLLNESKATLASMDVDPPLAVRQAVAYKEKTK